MAAAALFACTKDAPAPTPPPHPSASAESPSPPPPSAAASTAVVDAATASPVAAASSSAAGEIDAGPTVPLSSIPAQKEWPFHKWDRAEAILFNQVPDGPNEQLMVYEPKEGWNKRIAERKKIDDAQAKKAVGWVVQTNGMVPISKCPFPRHAVVLYFGNTPVGTANVCFQCGDILVWPDIDKPSELYAVGSEPRMKKKMAAYKTVFPLWRKLFEDEMKFPIKDFHP